MEGLNFLPWRQQIREHRRKQFIFAAGVAVVLGVALLIVAHVILTQRLQAKREVVLYLKNRVHSQAEEINRFQADAAKQLLTEQHKDVIQAIQSSKNSVVIIYDELIRLLPPSEVYLNQLQKRDNQISLTGFAKSEQAVARFINNLEQSKFFTDVSLEQIAAADSVSRQLNYNKKFKLKFLFQPKIEVGAS